RDVSIEDAHGTALPDQRLDHGDRGALAQVVGSLFEGEPHDADAALARLEYSLDPPANLGFVRGQDRREQRAGDVGIPGGVEQRAEVLRQTRAAEGKPGAQIRL